MPAEKSKQLRKYIAEIAFAVFVVSLCSSILESSHLMLNGPAQPDYASGLVYPFRIKGPVAYISASDANSVSLGLMICILSFGCIAYALGSIGRTADITSHSSDSHSFGFVFLISIAVAAASFFLFGGWIGNFLAAHGVVLHFYSQDLTRQG